MVLDLLHANVTARMSRMLTTIVPDTRVSSREVGVVVAKLPSCVGITSNRPAAQE